MSPFDPSLVRLGPRKGTGSTQWGNLAILSLRLRSFALGRSPRCPLVRLPFSCQSVFGKRMEKFPYIPHLLIPFGP